MAGPGEVGQGARSRPETGQITTEATPAGEQTVLPGTEKISDSNLATRGRKAAQAQGRAKKAWWAVLAFDLLDTQR
jgi:hypothetical protein